MESKPGELPIPRIISEDYSNINLLNDVFFEGTTSKRVVLNTTALNTVVAKIVTGNIAALNIVVS